MSILLHLQLRGVKRVLRGHDHFWKVIRTLGKDEATFTDHDVIDLSDADDTSDVRDYLRRLEAGGFIERTGTEKHGRTRSAVYRLRKVQDETPRINRDGTRCLQGRGQIQMWNVIRMGRPFNARELAVQASTDEVKVAHDTAKRYLRELENAGYLSIRDPGAGRRPRVFMLKPGHNTGPKPPAILRAKAVWDQNRNEIMGRLLAEEVPS